MVQCRVPSCKNRSDCQNWKKNITVNNKVKVTFHSFPKNSETCSLWLERLGIESSSISRSARICSMHFEEESFDRRGLHVRLRPNALPRVCINTLPLNSSQDCSNRELSSNADILLQKVSSLTPKTENERVTSVGGISNSFDECPLSSQPASKEDKWTMVSPVLVYNSPEKSRLRERIKFLEANSRKKIRSLQQKLRRQNNQVLRLKSILDDLQGKHLLNEN